MAKFRAHFANLYKGVDRPPGQAPHNAEFFEQQLRFNDKNFNYDELVTSLLRLKDEKAVGIDGIPNEILKLPELRWHVLKILNEMLRGNVFREQKETVIVPLPKKGDLSQATNWRGISLMPHLTKLFDMMVYQRLMVVIDPHLHPSQNGFRPGRGTTEHVLTLSILRDLSATHMFPIHGCFVDFSKAFDSVRCEDIGRQLEYWHVPSLLHDAVFNVMRGHVVRVRVDGELSEPIAVEVGVLQGDTLAPFLFNLVLDHVFRKLPTDCGVLLSNPAPKLSARQQSLYHFAETRLSFLAFADDVCLFTHTAADLQRLVLAFESLSLGVGLRMNMGKGKTERFYNGAPDPTVADVIKVTAGVIPLTDNYRYLGVWALNFEDEMVRKKGKAWAAVKTIDGVWQSCVSMSVKRQLFRSIVEPVLTYGLCAWPMTAERTARVDGMFGRLLRYGLGLPPSFVSHDLVGTEELYGDIPFLSTMLASRRVGLIAHTMRAHFDGRQHKLIDVLLFDPSLSLQPRRGPRVTVMSDVLHQCRIEFREQLRDVMLDRKKSRQLVLEVERHHQEAAYYKIFDRRILHLLSYFEMPRKELKKNIPDDAPLFMSMYCRRRPPTIWTRPRPTLKRGLMRFHWDHYHVVRRHAAAPDRYIKPWTAQQAYAINLAREKRTQKNKVDACVREHKLAAKAFAAKLALPPPPPPPPLAEPRILHQAPRSARLAARQQGSPQENSLPSFLDFVRQVECLEDSPGTSPLA